VPLVGLGFVLGDHEPQTTMSTAPGNRRKTEVWQFSFADGQPKQSGLTTGARG
jgi:hypothetical protein